MLKGRLIFEISPNQVLVAEGPWVASSQDAEWEFGILPFKPLEGVSPTILNAKHVRIVGREELSQSESGEIPQSLSWTPSARSLFTKSFQELKDLFQKGKAQKGVPWAHQTAQLASAQKYWGKLLQNITRLAPEQVIYGAEFPNEAVLGATPEWLFKLEAGAKVLHTMALAGTRWPGQIRSSEQEKKDAQEHALVVEDICSRLRPFGVVTTGVQSWLKAGSVEHLRTPIQLVANKTLDAHELIRVLHPTPAVGVFPRTPEAEAWLYQLPGHETRADFAAPWLVRHRDGRAWALVALRQLRLRADHVFIPAGCGVIAESVEEVEWKEIQEKINSVKLAWGLPG